MLPYVFELEAEGQILLKETGSTTGLNIWGKQKFFIL